MAKGGGNMRENDFKSFYDFLAIFDFKSPRGLGERLLPSHPEPWG